MVGLDPYVLPFTRAIFRCGNYIILMVEIEPILKIIIIIILFEKI
jgi:hypothetical protein